jgi:hypothetical protein
MPTNTQGQSDIVTHSTNIWNKVYSFQEALFRQWDFLPHYRYFGAPLCFDLQYDRGVEAI